MAAATRKKSSRTDTPEPEAPSTASAAESAMADQVRRGAGSAAGAAARLRALGIGSDWVVPEKEKLSITLDKPLVDELRAHFSGQALSATINELLYAALAQARLGELVDQMIAETGPPSPEAYERVLTQWYADE